MPSRLCCGYHSVITKIGRSSPFNEMNYRFRSNARDISCCRMSQITRRLANANRSRVSILGRQCENFPRV